MLNIIIILALLNTTLLHCAKKWGWIDLMQAHGWFKSPCYLCFGFWMAVVEMPFIATEWYHFFVPFASAAITNFMVNAAIINDRR